MPDALATRLVPPRQQEEHVLLHAIAIAADIHRAEPSERTGHALDATLSAWHAWQRRSR